MAPFVITATLIVCTLIAIKIKKEDILTIDGIFSVVGFGLGLLITSMNLIYSNNYLISLGPLLAIACLLYLRLRAKILERGADFNLNLNPNTLKAINIMYWVCISVALLSYHQATPYHRPPIFFICISLGVALLGLEILSSKFKDNFSIFSMMFKILLISLIIRASAYFISPYPIGSDPWGHADLIKSFLHFHNLTVTPEWPQNQYNFYYTQYPLAHLYVCTANLIGNISVKESMFVVGVVLALSTIFVYLIVKEITNNINLALLSMLLLSFADFHIQWSIEIIAMSFGIVIYTILIYLILKTRGKHQLLYTCLSIPFLFVIVWTHTVSAFIAMISVISLYLGAFVYKSIYREHNYKELLVSLTFCMILAVMMILHWMDPNYPFIESITRGLVNSLVKEAEFLGRLPSILQQQWESLLNILGFLIYIFFGIIGSLYCLSRKYADKTKVALVFMLIVLYFMFFAFPVMGMRNVMPYRWPAFIYVSFVLFVGIGLTGFLSLLKSKKQVISFALIVLFSTSFLMITTFASDMDSPVYGKAIIQKVVWTESEMMLFGKMNDSYGGVIVTDLQTRNRPFQTYLKREKSACYASTIEGDVDWDYMNGKLVIWRKVSLTRPVQMAGYRHPAMLLGTEFKNHLDNNFSCISDTREARAYL